MATSLKSSAVFGSPGERKNQVVGGDVKASSLARQKFIAANKEILDKLKNLKLNNVNESNDKEILESLNYLNKENSSLINSLTRNLSDDQTDKNFEFEKISKIFHKDNLKSALSENLKSDIKELSQILEKRIKKISQIVSYGKNSEIEFTNLQTEIKNFEPELNQVIENNSEYMTKNQIFLIRNEILQTFVNKIIITKEEKDNLMNKSKIDDLFFKLILKLKRIKYDIILIEKNSEKFSKTLLFSIKENFQIVEDLMNEKIVLYLKNTFREKTNFNFNEFKNIITTINFLKEKENYLNFILKEFTQGRKKKLEKILRNKFLKLNKLDEIFASLIEDFEFHFLKEFVILFNLFNTEREISSSYEEQNEIFYLLNYDCDEEKDGERSRENTMKNLERLIGVMVKKKENSKRDKNDFYINNLNTILYVLEELFYENVSNKNPNTTQSQFFSQSQVKSNLSEIYKVTILSTYYHTKIEKLFTQNLKFEKHTINENLNLFSMINNYKKSFSNLYIKILNECGKNLVKLQNSFKTMKEDSIWNSQLNKSLIDLAEEFSNCFEYFEKFSPLLKEEDRENLSPKNNNAFKIMMNFFENFIENCNSQNSLHNFSQNFLPNLLKAFNLNEIFYEKFQKFNHEEIKILENSLKMMDNLIVNNFLELILKSTDFEENLKSNCANDTIMNFMENLLEKCQLYFLDLNLVYDFNAKENLKENIKRKIINTYSYILKREENSNLKMNTNVFSEEEFSNYLELL